MDIKNEEYFKELINCYLSNQATVKEIAELFHWIDQSVDNKKRFFEYRRAWLLASQGTPRGKFNRAKYDEWEKLSGKLNLPVKNGAVKNLSTFRKVMSIAAAFLFLVAIGATIAWRITSLKLHELVNTETFHQVNVPLGGRSEVILPDGSKVRLNAGSCLCYQDNFGITERVVRLEGEGYFEVETNPQRPFVVEVYGLQIEAHGTMFNVKAYPDEEEVITTLVEGVLKVRGENIDLTMTPNQKLYISSQHGQVITVEEEAEVKKQKTKPCPSEKIPAERPVMIQPPKVHLTNNINIREITGWKDGVFIFTSEKLENLAVVLERKYDVSIKIESEELKNHRFTGTFENETLEQVLAIINLSAPIKYRVEKGVVSIKVDRRRSSVFKELSRN